VAQFSRDEFEKMPYDKIGDFPGKFFNVSPVFG
jgi:hypothetical protein